MSRNGDKFFVEINLSKMFLNEITENINNLPAMQQHIKNERPFQESNNQNIKT